MIKLPLSEDNPDGSLWELGNGTVICSVDLIHSAPGWMEDALKELLNEHALMQQIPEPSEKIMENQDAEIERLKAEVDKWKEKFWEQRKHCRSANKGAERNGVVMRLLAQDCKELKEKIKRLES